MKGRLSSVIMFIFLLTGILLLPNGKLLALNPQPEPPMVASELKTSIKILPIDALDPQPEPPIEVSELKTSIKILPIDALDPQPEPPIEGNELKTSIIIPPINALNPQPEPPVFAKNIKILINNIPYDSLDPQPEPPMIYQNRTLVPMRAIFERLGAEVEWEGITKTITAKKGTMVISMSPGVATATVNGQTVNLDAAPILYNNRTFVPLRFVSQSLGNNVEWNEQTQTVSINK